MGELEKGMENYSNLSSIKTSGLVNIENSIHLRKVLKRNDLFPNSHSQPFLKKSKTTQHFTVQADRKPTHMIYPVWGREEQLFLCLTCALAFRPCTVKRNRHPTLQDLIQQKKKKRKKKGDFLWVTFNFWGNALLGSVSTNELISFWYSDRMVLSFTSLVSHYSSRLRTE